MLLLKLISQLCIKNCNK